MRQCLLKLELLYGSVSTNLLALNASHAQSVCALSTRCTGAGMRRLLACIFVFLFASARAEAQFLPGGCPGQWVQAGFGMACQCPDGSLASGWPMSCGHSMTPPQVQGQYCSNSGGICPPGTYCSSMPGRCVPDGRIDCGNYNCGIDQKCASDQRYPGCLAADAVECGRGRSCSGGTSCWFAPMDIAGIPKGELRCVTAERSSHLQQQVVEERERRKELERQKREEETAQKKKAEEEKRQAARRKEEEKAKAAAEAKLKATAPGRQKVSDILAKEQERLRAEELKKTPAQKQREMQQFLAEYGPRSPNCKLMEIGYGAEAGKACALKELQPPSRTSSSVPPIVPSNSDDVRKQLEAIARAESASKGEPTTERVTRPMNPITQEQLNYLRQNAASLQPEQRRLPTQDSLGPSWDRHSGDCSTFPNPNLPRGGCPPPPTQEQAAEAAKRQKQIAEEAEKADAQRIAREQEAVAKARAEEKRKEDEARAKIYQTRDVDDSDCRGMAVPDPARYSWCGARGQAGLRRCEIIIVVKSCEKRTLRDHCVETSRVRQDACR